MDNSDANNIYRPDLIAHINAYLQGQTPMERQILFQNVKTVIEEMQQINVPAPLLFHYLCTTLQGNSIFVHTNLMTRFADIKKIIQIIYKDNPDPQHTQTLCRSLLIYVGKMNARIKGAARAEKRFAFPREPLT